MMLLLSQVVIDRHRHLPGHRRGAQGGRGRPRRLRFEASFSLVKLPISRCPGSTDNVRRHVFQDVFELGLRLGRVRVEHDLVAGGHGGLGGSLVLDLFLVLLVLIELTASDGVDVVHVGRGRA